MTSANRHNSLTAKIVFLFLLAFFAVIAFRRLYDRSPNGNALPSLLFEAKGNEALAVFRRGKYLWIIFENTPPLDISEMRRQSSAFIEEIVALPNARSLILRLRPMPGYQPLVRRSGNDWKIDFHRQELPFARSETPVALRQTPNGRNYLFFPDGGYGKTISLIDPAIGDTLLILTSRNADSAVNYGYRYPDLELLPSYQGIAMVANRDDLYSEKISGGIAVKAARGTLHIDARLPQLRRRVIASQNLLYRQSVAEILTNACQGESFNQTEKILISAIFQSTQDYKSDARLQLAAYYLSMGLASPATAVLTKILNSDAAVEPALIAARLTAIADFLQRRYAASRHNLTFNQPDYPEKGLWLALIEAAENPDRPQAGLTPDHLAELAAYPPAVQAAVARQILPYVINYGGEDAATKLIISLRQFPRYTAAADYFTALNLEKRQKLNAARAFYHTAAQSLQRPYSVYAGYRLTLLDLDNAPDGPGEAAAQLERLYFGSDDIFFRRDLLLRLAEFYFRQGKREHALGKLTLLNKKYKIGAGIEKDSLTPYIKYEPLRQFYRQSLQNGSDNERTI